tara:strand:+ start:9158 stop:9898 length:741 start_codon:yes stop_codon:yes gene_type:complete
MLNVTARQELLSRIADTISIVVEEARFDFSENGLNIRVVDPSHVAMVKLDVDAVAFETWEVEEAMVGLEMKKLKELISLGAADDIISMTYDGKGDVLMNLGKIDRSSRPLDNNTLNPPNLPNLDLPCSVTIRGSELAQAFRAARQVGDLVTLSVDPEKFTIHVSGPNDSVTVVYGHDELQGITCDSPAKSQYSLTYLVPLGKVFNSIESVTIAFGENFPLAMDFTFSDGSGSVKYFLAPRVEQEGY